MAPAATRASASIDNFGLAWVLLCLAFCAHVADEALTGFLDVYNPTVTAMRARVNWFPMPTFEYREWLVGLILVNLVLVALTPFGYRNARGLRPVAYLFAAIMLLNGMGHTFFYSVGPDRAFGPVPTSGSGLLFFAFSAYYFDLSLRAATCYPQGSVGLIGFL